MNTQSIIFNIACSVAGAILYAFGTWTIRYFAERRGAYTGIWQAEIIDSSGQVEKVDQYEFRHSGDIIHGVIRRVSPSDQTHRKWKMYGRIRGRDFFAIFWSIDQNVLSYGCWYLHQTNDFSFEGNYLRVNEGTSGIAIQPIPLRVSKLPSNPLIPHNSLYIRLGWGKNKRRTK